MKIGLVCPYNIFRGGGVQEVVLALQREMSNVGHTVRVITPLPRDYKGPSDASTIFIGTAATMKSPFHTIAEVSVSLKTEEIDTMLQREQFDILHFHEPWVPIMSRQLLSRSTTVPNVATFHAKLPETVVSRTIERVITPYTKSIMKSLGHLTAVSDAAAEYVQTLTKRKINIIPNGIDLTTYQQKTTVAHKQKTILYIGRLEKRKGVKYLIQAYGLLVKREPNVRLIIAGEGPDHLKLEQMVKENAIPRVTFLGFVDETTKCQLLKDADLFCSPAPYGESFGIVLLEAMATGTVLVAGNNSGYASVMQGRGGLSIVDPKDIAGFARRLQLFLWDEDLQKLWQTWAADYVQQFDYVRVAGEYESLYKQVAGK